MPSHLQLAAWSDALRWPLVLFALAFLVLLALAIATGVTPQPLYADPSPLRFM